MTFVKFDPLRGFEKMGRRMNELAKEFEHGFNFETGGFNPRVDISEDKQNVYVVAELSGLTKENVKISVSDDNVLTIKGEKKRGEIPEGKSYLRTERFWGEFSRSFVLPENLNKEAITAKFEDGILELSIPKVEPPLPKEIEIQIG